MLGVLLAIVAPASSGATGHVLYAWTELAPTTAAPSGLIARAITDGAPCPALRIRGRHAGSVAMRVVTTGPGIVGFSSIRACRAAIPGGTTAAFVGAHRLPLLGTKGPVAVIGDTGCRMKGKHVQDCASPSGWPFAALAKRVASTRPRYVIHVGDYEYREESCSSVSAKKQPYCQGSPPVNPAGSPNPDNWALWQADFFAPAAPLLAAAPILPLRGNHESCSRAGNGYFLLLDPSTASPHTCAAIVTGKLIRPYAVDVQGLRLVVLDSSDACDFNAARPAWFRETFREAARLAAGPGPRWLVTHRPLWGFYTGQTVDAVDDNEGCSGAVTSTTWLNYELQTTASHLERYDAIVAGHVHSFEAVQIPGRPPQLVVGNGGTALDSSLVASRVPPVQPPFHSKAPTYLNAIPEYGYGLVRPSGSGWQLKEYGLGGQRFTTCRFGGAPMRCS